MYETGAQSRRERPLRVMCPRAPESLRSGARAPRGPRTKNARTESWWTPMRASLVHSRRWSLAARWPCVISA